jgi:hypothetical protein
MNFVELLQLCSFQCILLSSQRGPSSVMFHVCILSFYLPPLIINSPLFYYGDWLIVFEKLSATVILLVTNPLMSLMIPSNMAFGFEQGFQNGVWYADVRILSSLSSSSYLIDISIFRSSNEL